MNIKLICIGRLKEQYLKDACAEYIKRISRFAHIEVCELPEYKLPENPSPAQTAKAISEESAALLRAADKADYVIALDISGRELSSPGLAEHIREKTVSGVSTLAFIIGGSNGYDDSIRHRADLVLSFSHLTFPHRLFRVMLLEQIYRVFKINAGERYHK